jgi:hypothetical protein
MMAVEKEIVIEFSKMLTEHVNSLWEIAGGLVIVEILMVAHTLAAQKLPFSKSKVSWTLLLSGISSAASFVCGYLANAAALANFQSFAAGTGEWSPSWWAEFFNLLQLTTLSIAFLIFAFAFLFYSSILAESLIKSVPAISGSIKSRQSQSSRCSSASRRCAIRAGACPGPGPPAAHPEWHQRKLKAHRSVLEGLQRFYPVTSRALARQ